MSRVKALIITGLGLNCEKETAVAFEAAGASASKIHLNDLILAARCDVGYSSI